MHLAYSLTSKQERLYGIVNNGSGPIPEHEFEMVEGNNQNKTTRTKAVEMIDINE